MTDAPNPFKAGDRVKHLYGAFGRVAHINGFHVWIVWDDPSTKLHGHQHFSNLYFAGSTFRASGSDAYDDAVTRPAHYQRGGIETIDYIKASLGAGASDYMIGNVLKYVSRFKDKDGVRDLKKARQYLDWAIAEMEKTA
jgi:hypothetical protein